MPKSVILVFVIALIFFAPTKSYATDDLIWAIPKPGPLNNDQAPILDMELRPLPKSLSTIKPFIVGGSPTTKSKYPEYSLLLYDGLDGYLYSWCGGSLITPNKILTAAHCTEDLSAWRLYVIPEFHSFYNDFTWDKLIAVTQKVEHPNYNKSTFLNNDIAILTIENQASTAKAKIYGGTKQFAGYTSNVIGTGRLSGGGNIPSTLQEVKLPVISNTKCAGAWGLHRITSSMMCAGGTISGGIGSCSGDSGGPLFVKLNNSRVQAGIVSWGHAGCAVPGYYDVYARASSLIGFVRQNAPGATIISEIISDPTLDLSDINIAPILELLLLEHY